MSTDKPAAQPPVVSTWDPGSDFNTQIQYQILNNAPRSYQITVNLGGDMIAEKTLSTAGDLKLHFSVRPDLDSKAVYGVVLLAPPLPGIEPDWQLLAAVAHDPAGLSNYQILDTWPADDDVYKPIPGNTPARVLDADAPPYWFVGRLEMDFKGTDDTPSTYYGSATIIGATDNDGGTTIYSLLTAAHNVRDTTKLTCMAVRFYPRENGQAIQPQAVAATAWYCPGQATPIDGVPIADDYAVVTLEPTATLLPAGATVPKVVALGDDELGKQPPVTLVGLYWWDPNNGRAMYVGTGKIDGATASELRYPVSTRPGASGTAITLASDALTIIGVHDKAGGATQPYNIGHRITAASRANILAWLP